MICKIIVMSVARVGWFKAFVWSEWLDDRAWSFPFTLKPEIANELLKPHVPQAFVPEEILLR